MPSLTELKRVGYRQQRTASLGATVTLLSCAGRHTALFECATKVASVLCDRNLQDIGDGLLEYIPFYCIPNEQLNEALLKLSKSFSIALVEYSASGQFVCLWKINRVSTPTTNLDDY